jgi:CheY-like chemotaxis protein
MGHASSSPLAVLLVQRDDDSRDMYAEFLRHRGCVVRCAASAALAWTLVPRADVIVTGVQLQGDVDGFEFVTRLRGDHATARKPVVMLTSWAWQTERLRAGEVGCDAFLTKPCLPSVLLDQIVQVISARKLAGVRTKPIKAQPRRTRRRPVKRVARG